MRTKFLLGLVALTVLGGALLFEPSGFGHEPQRAEATNLNEIRKLLASDAAARDWFGYSVAVDGDVAVVGAPYEFAGNSNDGGAVYVLLRDQGGMDNWGEVAKLTASDAESDDHFGVGVAVSGDTAVVGAHYEDAGGDRAGAAYVFQRNEGGVGNWGEVTKLTASDAQSDDRFGTRVAISDDTAVVGADGEDAAGIQAGAAYVFQRGQGGADNWGEVKKLTAVDAEPGDIFGISVAVSGDTAVVGAVGEDAGGNGAGAAYVFQRNDGGLDNWGEVTKLTASDAQAIDLFGYYVAVSGDTAVVGATHDHGSFFEDDGGAAYVFLRDQGGADNWGEVAKLTASDAQDGDSFGYSVAVSGDIAVVGAYREDGGAGDPFPSAGAAYVFGRNQGGAENWGEVTKLTASDAEGVYWFGISVAVSGDTAFAGAPLEDAGGNAAGAAYVFDLLLSKPTATQTPPPPVTPPETPTPGPPPEPAVLLVHGYGGSCSGTFAALKPWLEGQLGVPAERIGCFNYNEKDGVITSAFELNNYVKTFVAAIAPTPGGKINIVAHSFGGLVSRWYVEKIMQGDAPVSSLTMLGTPNYGTYSAAPMRLWDFFSGEADYAAEDMLKKNDTLERLNPSGYQIPPGTRYLAVAGTWCAIGICGLTTAPSDCIVTQSSAEGPFPQLNVQSRAVRHAAGIGLCPFASALTNDQPASNCGTPAYVFCDVLFNIQGSGAGSPAGGQGTPAGAVPPSAAGTGFLYGSVSTGNTDEYAGNVDASVSTAIFSLYWDGDPSAISLELERPDMSIVGPSDTGVTYTGPSELFPGVYVETYEIAAPVTGGWLLRAKGLSTPPAGQLYALIGQFDSPVGLVFDPAPAYGVVGQPSMLTATLDESGSPITGATVQVTVTRPDFTSEVIALADNGVAPDVTASDGTYTGALSDTNQCGSYLLEVEATGTATAGAFSRGDLAFYDATVDGDAAGDPCEVDEDTDGCIDEVELGEDETLGGRRNPFNPWDFYDVAGAPPPIGDGNPDGIIDLPNDILGVIQHFAPQGQARYDAQFDRGSSTGPNPWNMTAPDGVIDLPNDILGVILQFGHNCT